MTCCTAPAGPSVSKPARALNHPSRIAQSGKRGPKPFSFNPAEEGRERLHKSGQCSHRRKSTPAALLAPTSPSPTALRLPPRSVVSASDHLTTSYPVLSSPIPGISLSASQSLHLRDSDPHFALPYSCSPLRQSSHSPHRPGHPWYNILHTCWTSSTNVHTCSKPLDIHPACRAGNCSVAKRK